MGRIIYSVTVNVDDSVEQDWVDWMKSVHIPDVMNTGQFLEHKFCKVLVDMPDGGTNYSIQYVCESMETLQDYQANHAPALQKEHIDRYGEKCIAFRTLLEEL